MAKGNRKDYEHIEGSYDRNMERSTFGVTNAVDTSNVSYDGQASGERLYGGAIVKIGKELQDIWLSTWMKSRNYLPKSKGFKMDARTGDVEFQDLWVRSLTKKVGAGLTATAGGGEANALRLTSDISEVSTVATGGDSVKLPTVGNDIGRQAIIINHGANSLDIFPDNAGSSDTLNGGAGAVSIGANETCMCTAYAFNVWEGVTLTR